MPAESDVYFIQLGSILETVRVSSNLCLKENRECGRALTMLETAIDVIKNGIENDYFNRESAEKLIERLEELKSKIEEKIEV